MPDAADTPTPPPPCSQCGTAHVVRNGRNAAGTPNFRCRACDRRLVAAPRTGPVPDDTTARIERLRAERLSLRTVARAVGVSRAWLQQFVNAQSREGTPHHPGPVKQRPAGG